MMKRRTFTYPVIVSFLLIIGLLSGCASTEIERRLESNFVYQCSKKLLDDVEKKITGEDAARICVAAEKSDAAEREAEATVVPAVLTVVTASPTPART